MQEEKKTQAEDEINLLDYLIVILKRKKLILKTTLGIALLVGIIVYIMPNKYTAQVRFVPPANDSSSAMASALISQLGSLSSLAGSALGVESPGAKYVSIVTGRTVLDKIIDRFGLMTRYKGWINIIFPYYREDCRTKLIEDIVTAETDDSSGIVSLTILEEDPKMAADMANAFVEELKGLTKVLAVTEAAQRRTFYEDQMKLIQDKLVQAEEAMRSFQEKTGALQPDDQARAVIAGDAAIRAQIAATEVQLKVARTFSTPNNPDLQKLAETLRGLKAEQAKLEKMGGSGFDPLMSSGRMPSEGLEYVRKLREVKFNEQLYELLLKLYESAKLDEARDAVIIQVVDKAVTPEKKAKPKRVLIIIIAAFVGFCLAIVAAFILESKDKALTYPGNRERMELLRTYGRLRKKKEAPDGA